MSVVDLDKGIAPGGITGEITPVFDQATVDEVVAEISTTPLAEVEQVNIDRMNASGNWTLAQLHEGIVGEAVIRYGADVSRKLSAGYMAGYSILWRAAADRTLPVFTPEQVDAYAYHATLGANLREDVERDYAEHEVVLSFLREILTNPDSRSSAQLIFGLHGRWANPGRPPIHIPNPPPVRNISHRTRPSRSMRGTSYGQAMSSADRFGLK